MEGQGSASSIPNNSFDVFNMTHAKHKEIFSEGKNVAQVAFRSIISMDLV